MESSAATERGFERGPTVMIHRNTVRLIFASVAGGAQLALGLVFIWAAIAKLRLPWDFLHAVFSYEMVGPSLGVAIAVVLPAIELVVGLLLVGNIFKGGALLISIVLSCVFVVVQVHAIRDGLNIACGCFGGATSGDSAISYGTLFRAAAMGAAALLAYIHHLYNPPALVSLDNSAANHNTPIDLTRKGAEVHAATTSPG